MATEPDIEVFSHVNASQAPLNTGAPTWVAYYDLIAAADALGSAPAITLAAGGNPLGYFQYTPQRGSDFVGLIDHGAFNIGVDHQRYKEVLKSFTCFVFTLKNISGAYLTGKVPTWESLIDVATGLSVPTAQRPAIVEIGSGLYFTGLPPLDGQRWHGRINGDPVGSLAYPKYTAYSASFNSRAVGEKVAPLFQNISPVSGAALASSQPIYFEILKLYGLMRRVVVHLEYPKAAKWDVAFDGDVWRTPYQKSRVVTASYAPGNTTATLQQYTLNPPPGGWPETPVLHVRALDRAGNEAVL